LIFRALAIRRRRSAGLTYFFFPLGLVADRRAFDVFEAVAFFDPGLLDAVVFFLWLVVDAAASVDVAFGAAMRFPSSGTTAIKAQSTAANSRAGACVGTREATECIVSMYADFGVSEHQRITTVTYPPVPKIPTLAETR